MKKKRDFFVMMIYVKKLLGIEKCLESVCINASEGVFVKHLKERLLRPGLYDSYLGRSYEYVGKRMVYHYGK